MFSGIIERVGGVAAVTPGQGDRQLSIMTGFADLALGESVAVNGVCLTVTFSDDTGRMEVFVSRETLARSNLGDLVVGSKVNLERAVTLETRLSGHLVQGHVDGRATLVAVIEEPPARRMVLRAPAALRRYCVEKGSIALDGISLTLNRVGEPDRPDGVFEIELTLIPHTWDHTHLGDLALGAQINVEVDVFAKYVEQLCRGYLTPSNA